MVSCRFSLKPIHWVNGSEDLEWFGDPSHRKAWREVLQQLVPGLAQAESSKNGAIKPRMTPMDRYPPHKMCTIHVLTLTYTSFLHIWMCYGSNFVTPLESRERCGSTLKTSPRNWSKRNSTIYRKPHVYHKSMGKHCKSSPKQIEVFFGPIRALENHHPCSVNHQVSSINGQCSIAISPTPRGWGWHC